MDMQFELQGLRTLISEKTELCNQLKKEVSPSRTEQASYYLRYYDLSNVELCNHRATFIYIQLAMIKRLEQDSSKLFEFEGSNTLGSQFHIIPRVDDAPDISSCPAQWYRVIAGGSRELISGM
jgi:hypothetical protein